VDTFSGTGSELVRTLTDASGAAVKPDLVWIKDRDTAVEHVITDSTRGATKEINADHYNVESTVSEGLKSFDTSGYTLGTDGNYNTSSSLNVAWCWNTQGGAGSSNTDGSINTTTTSVGATQGMSISTYTGTGANATVGHGLNNAPRMLFVASRDTEQGFTQYHEDAGNTKTRSMWAGSGGTWDTAATRWNSTSPTSTVFSLGSSGAANGSTKTFVAYCFEEIEGYSRHRSFEGNGSTDGSFVWCGFRPALIWISSLDSGSEIFIYDSKRDGYNVDNDYLTCENPAEQTSDTLDILSNGFKLRTTSDPNIAETYVFSAWAEFPFGGDGVSQARAR
jgi:hypothetical protein